MRKFSAVLKENEGEEGREVGVVVQEELVEERMQDEEGPAKTFIVCTLSERCTSHMRC